MDAQQSRGKCIYTGLCYLIRLLIWTKERLIPLRQGVIQSICSDSPYVTQVIEV